MGKEEAASKEDSDGFLIRVYLEIRRRPEKIRVGTPSLGLSWVTPPWSECISKSVLVQFFLARTALTSLCFLCGTNTLIKVHVILVFFRDLKRGPSPQAPGSRFLRKQ